MHPAEGEPAEPGGQAEGDEHLGDEGEDEDGGHDAPPPARLPGESGSRTVAGVLAPGGEHRVNATGGLPGAVRAVVARYLCAGLVRA